MSGSKREYPLDKLLAECRETSAAIQHLPGPLSERLDKLIDQIRTQGQIPRWEFVSALILDASPDPASSIEILKRFREATVRDAILGTPEDEKVLVLETHRPGRRQRTNE
jgi:hypothetical protein